MRASAIAVVFVAVMASAMAAQVDSNSKGAALQKVITMLTDMKAKGKQEKQEEQVRFASYKQFCESTTGEKSRNIAKGKEDVEQLQASIAKAEADVQVATKHVAGLDADVTQWTSDLEASREERAKEHKAFEEAHRDYLDSIDAVERALKMLKAGPDQGAASFQQVSQDMFALLQIHGEKMSQHARKVLMSFLQKQDPGKALLQEAFEEGISVNSPAMGAHEANAFESSSGGVITMVEELGDKFDNERIALEKGEANARSAFEMMQSDLESQIKMAGEERSNKESHKAQRATDAAEAKGDLADTSAALAEDEKYLADLTAECDQKTFDYDNRQVMRQGEIDAIGKAIEIMSGTTAAADKHLSLAQVSGGVSLAQLRARTQSDVLEQVANFLQQRAGETKSRILMLLATKAASDPFVKVKKMIRDMVQKLMEEANEEAEHKGFCDTEMGTNAQTRDQKTAEIEELNATIEGLTADIAKLGTEIVDLGNQIAEIDSAVRKATADRDEEKAKNQETIQDSTVAAEAVAQALQLLKDFYAKAAEPIEQPAPQQGAIKWDARALQNLNEAKGGASFVQTGATKNTVPGAPDMEEGQYSGMANGGVLGLMEVVQSDFAKVISETTASEADAAKIYDQFMADSDQDKAVKETDRTHKTNGRQSKESKVATAHKDLRITQDELHAAMEYYEKLKPSCEEKVVSYEEKVAQRKAEIESLQEALQILSGDNI